MSSIIKRVFFIKVKKVFLSPLLFLFPTIVFACSMVFHEITPGELKARLFLIAENKKEEIESLDIDTSVPYTLSFSSKTGIRFQITKDSSLSKPEIELSSSVTVLKVPSYEWLYDNSSVYLLKRWLIGHEIHPYTSPSKSILYTEAQNTAFVAFRQALIEGVRSFLHISPTSTGKTLVMAKALKEKLQNHQIGKISFVTAHQIRLVDQLFEAAQAELKGMDVTVINWNDRVNKDFYVEIERSLGRTKPTVFVITTQSLKSQLSFLQHEKTKDYDRLVENTDGIYIDEAHHLGAYYTKSALLQLQERSGAFLYGTTATPVHHEVNLRDFFEREHWSYLNTIKRGNLFASHPAEKVIEQLSIAIERGEITRFDDLYILGENSFDITKEKPLFTQTKSFFRVLNPDHYNRLARILYPILSSNKKGFIVTATIAEAKRLTDFLNEAIEGITFEAYHSDMTREQRQEVLKNSEEMPSHYMVAVRALDEGVNLPHLSAYIDLNVNVSVKQMVHRIGRALRLYPGKTGADILFLADYRNQEMAKDLLQVLDVVDVSSFRGGVRHRGASGDSGLRGSGVTPLTREELRALREELKQFAASFWSGRRAEKPPYEEVVETLKRKNIMWGYQWDVQWKIDPELQRIPYKLHQAYPEWSWRKLRGEIPKVSYKRKPSYRELIRTLMRRNITSESEWETQREQHPELQRFPKNLLQGYAEWKGWRPFREQTGKGKPSYNELIKTLIRKDIISGPEWKIQRETDPELQRFPKTIEVYPEWKGWPHFRAQIGKDGRPSNKEFPPEEESSAYKELKEILIRKDIMSGPEWTEQRKTDAELQHLPRTLGSYVEWRGWSHFRKQIGREARKPPKKEKSSEEESSAYKELKEILIRKDIISGPEWTEQRETDPELRHFLKNLRGYPEWKGWRHFREQIGKGKPSRADLIEFLRARNIMTKKEWEEQWDADPGLRHIPRHLPTAYLRWSWYEVKGKPPRVSSAEKPPYDILIATLRRKTNITNQTEYEEQRDSDPELHSFPKDLRHAYPEWKGWPHFREQADKTKISDNGNTVDL